MWYNVFYIERTDLMIIDTHCHLDKEDYEDVEEIISHMENNIMIVCTATLNDLEEVIKLCEAHDNIYGTIGIHPEFASTYTDENLKNIEKYLTHPKVVAIGEIGLDYHYTKETKEKQKQLLIKQIKLANKYHKTIVMHTRDALEDAIQILKQYKDPSIKVDFHCYEGDEKQAEKLLKLNATFGIGGILTFKNDTRLKQVVKSIPLTNIVFETDCPYLTPVPLRGHRNEPVYVKYTAKFLADYLNKDLDKIIDITTRNAIRQFDLPIKL